MNSQDSKTGEGSGRRNFSLLRDRNMGSWRKEYEVGVGVGRVVSGGHPYGRKVKYELFSYQGLIHLF